MSGKTGTSLTSSATLNSETVPLKQQHLIPFLNVYLTLPVFMECLAMRNKLTVYST